MAFANSARPATGTLKNESDKDTLAELMDDQSKALGALIGETSLPGQKDMGALVGEASLPSQEDILDILEAAKSAADDTLTQIRALPSSQTGTLQGIQLVQAYIAATAELVTLSVFLKSPGYTHLMTARLDLISSLNELIGTAPPQITPAGIITDFDAFSDYLKRQRRAIDFIQQTGADLPPESLLKTVLLSWQRVIEKNLPKTASDSDGLVVTNSSRPTRADLVEGYVGVDSVVGDLIARIDDILGDRNLLDPTIL